MSTAIERLKDGLLALFLKPNCPLCDRPADGEFCTSCQRQLQRCQLTTPDDSWKGELPVLAWGNYGGVLKRAIAALKYDNQPQLARPLGHWLAQAWRKSPAASRVQKLTVMSIPLHPLKLKKRGYNQAELIAKNFCDGTGYKHQPLGLERIRETEAQFGLSAQARKQNLANAFRIGNSLYKHPPNSPVLLIDDIYTTGATVRAAAQILQRKGIKVYGVAAIATSSFNHRS